jgi:hypothetical protein
MADSEEYSDVVAEGGEFSEYGETFNDGVEDSSGNDGEESSGNDDEGVCVCDSVRRKVDNLFIDHTSEFPTSCFPPPGLVI